MSKCLNPKALPELKKKICEICEIRHVMIKQQHPIREKRGKQYVDTSMWYYDNYPNQCQECFDEWKSKVLLKETKI